MSAGIRDPFLNKRLQYLEIRPISCKSCGILITPLEEQYLQMIKSGISPKEALDSLGYQNECCRNAMWNVAYRNIFHINKEKLYGASMKPIVKQVSQKRISSRRKFELPEIEEKELSEVEEKSTRKIQAQTQMNLEMPKTFAIPSNNLNKITLEKNGPNSVFASCEPGWFTT